MIFTLPRKGKITVVNLLKGAEDHTEVSCKGV